MGREKRRAFIDQEYWARPVPGFGDPDGRIFVLGLAPAAHGANRTGRVFTGDRSGDWLFAALHRAGLANQPVSQSADDGLELFDTYVSAAVKCAPPDNRPTIDERDNCFGYLPEEFQALGNSRVILCLGGFAWKQGLKLLEATGEELPRPKPRFGHGHRLQIGQYSMVGCYHPSQQNTFTGRLTEEMLDDVLQVAKAAASI